MRRMTGSWLSGPAAALPKGEDGSVAKYRGERLGLPESGPRSVGGTGRKVTGLLIDWLLCYGVAMLLLAFFPLPGGPATTGAVVWAVVSVVSVWLFAATPGQTAMGLGVARVDAEVPVGLPRAFFRVLLTFFILPPLVMDEDGRGLHDRATQTAVICAR
ncbi:RDD family protein [Tomitella cavernea]|nr:RDD family protein [Tomitella cavernea]